jgi:glutamyl-tRNA reductase
MLVCLTAHQRTTPLEDLERLSVLGDAAASELAQAHDAIRGAVVLATCNRFEAYFDVDDHLDPSPLPAMDAAMERIADLSALSFRRVRDTVDFAHGNDVAQHLFTVARGSTPSPSANEIAGQVKRALECTARRRHHRPARTPLPARDRDLARRQELHAPRRVGALAGTPRGRARRLARRRLGGCARPARRDGALRRGILAALRAVGAQDIRVHSRSGRSRFAQREHLVPVSAADYRRGGPPTSSSPARRRPIRTR